MKLVFDQLERAMDEKEQAMERIQEWNGMNNGLAVQSNRWIHNVIAIDHRSNAYSKLT